MIDITWIEPQIAITVDMSRLSWGDLKTIRQLQAGDEASAEAAIERLVTKVTGVEAVELPAQAFAAIVQQMMERASGNTAKN